MDKGENFVCGGGYEIMAPPHEGSIFCEKCSCYNLQATECIIIDGKAYCESCLEDMGINLPKIAEKIPKTQNE